MALAIALVTGCASGADNNDSFGVGAPMQGDDTGSTNFTSSITAASTLEGGASESDTLDDDADDDDDADTTASLDAADDDADDDGTTGSAESTGDDGMDESTTDGGEESSGGGESTGVGEMCPQLATCAGASGLGSVSGDSGSADLFFNGSEPTWLEFQVTEDNDDVVGEDLRFTVTLTSPGCCDFDLYVYRGAEGGTTGCDGFLESSISVGAVDSVSMDWGEGLVANGVDDSAWVAVEIVPKNDECQDGQDWDLVVEGDT